MNHPSETTFVDYRSGRLSQAQRQAIVKHLANCAACKSKLDQPSDDALNGYDGEITQLDGDSIETDSASENAPRPAIATSDHRSRFEILGELGRGGMGVVYRALDSRLKREVALKVILARKHADSHDVERFRVEAETSARLAHPGIVRIYEVGEHDGYPCMVLELVEGSNLQEYLKPGLQSPEWAAAVLLQLAEAIHSAHLQGVVHRDLKPENVLLCDPSRGGSDSGSRVGTVLDSDPGQSTPAKVPVVKITDFGLARNLDSNSDLTKSGILMGTPAFMAPEQASGDGRHAGPPADLYSLGAILYYMLTGEPPFAANDVMVAVLMVLEDDPLPPSQLNRRVSRDLDTICLKCLMKEPSARYESAEALAVDLRAFLDGEPIAARPLNAWGRLHRWARRRPFLAVTYSIGVLMSLQYVLLKFVIGRGLPNEADDVVPIVIPVGMLAITICQWLMDVPRYRELGCWLLSVILFVIPTIGFTLLDGPDAPAVGIFSVAIVTSLLINVRQLWPATSLAIICWTWLNIHAWLYKPQITIKGPYTVGSGLCFLLMGIALHLVLRRFRNAGRSVSGSSVTH
ncbi:MAG: protein kinase [Planctomycetota bacterium]|nr:protein kinase [Planctomycetota bacterium]